MKQILFPIGLALSLAILSCRKDKSPIGPVNPDPIDTLPIDTTPVGADTAPYSSMWWGNYFWEPHSFFSYDLGFFDSTNRGTMILEFREPKDNWPYGLYSLKIRYFKQILGKQQLSRSKDYSRPYVLMGFFDYDAPVETYYADTAYADNYIELTHIDTVKHIMEGVFNCAIIRSGDTLAPIEPGLENRYLLKDGKFRVKYRY